MMFVLTLPVQILETEPAKLGRQPVLSQLQIYRDIIIFELKGIFVCWWKEGGGKVGTNYLVFYISFSCNVWIRKAVSLHSTITHWASTLDHSEPVLGLGGLGQFRAYSYPEVAQSLLQKADLGTSKLKRALY